MDIAHVGIKEKASVGILFSDFTRESFDLISSGKERDSLIDTYSLTDQRLGKRVSAWLTRGIRAQRKHYNLSDRKRVKRMGFAYQTHWGQINTRICWRITDSPNRFTRCNKPVTRPIVCPCPEISSHCQYVYICILD